MKKRCRSAWFLFLSLPLILWIFSDFVAGAADPLEYHFQDFGGLNEFLQGRVAGAALLRASSAADPATATAGCLALGVNPWLDLINKASYSLKLSLPLTWGPHFNNWYDNGGNLLGAGFLASVQLTSFPPRFGSWTLNTGLFYLRKDLITPDQPFFAMESENVGGLGAINISIIY